MNSLTEENYLKTLLALSAKNNEVTVNDLAHQLGIKMPTVTSMMKKLNSKKLVVYESYKPIKLTDKGKKEAAKIVRKHRLTEMFLVEKMGFGWEEVHEIAEQIEHIQSPMFFDKMDHLLGYPKIDPHGSPIPDKLGKIESIAHVKLSECNVGDKLILRTISDSSVEFLNFLNSRELKLGLTFKVNSKESFDGTMSVTVGKRNETLSRMVSEKLMMERIS